jgi:hypothetical protein
MDINIWIEMIYQYGPYSILVLFVFWVAPKQTERFLKCSKDDNASRVLCGSFAVVSWLIIVTMTGYIFTNWTTTEVYKGTLGKYKVSDSLDFFTIDSRIYISSRVVASPSSVINPGNGDPHMEWKFVVIADSLQSASDDPLTISYGVNGTYFDGQIALADLNNILLKLSVDPEHPEVLLYDNDNNPNTAAVPYNTAAVPYSNRKVVYKKPATLFSFKNWMAAYAAESPNKIITDLNSSNKYVQAYARNQLRKLPLETLNSMLQQTSNDSLANRQIAQEIKGRIR